MGRSNVNTKLREKMIGSRNMCIAPGGREIPPSGSNRVKVPPFSPGLAEDAGEAGLL